MGDNMPDFSSMTPEEQMRWLESLAKRQGADSDQLTTSADMEVEELNPDEVDMSNVGPGYVPSETFSFSTHNNPPPPVATPPAPEPAAAPPPPPEPIADEAPAASGELDMEALANSDPMAFLEALAARQGADPNTFVSGSKMEVPELDEDSVDQSNFGPGYVPSETFSWSESNQQPAQRQAAPEPPAEPVQEIPPEPPLASEATPPPTAMQEAAVPEQSPPPSEMSMEELAASDPAAFMRALAARQGADPATLGDGDDSFMVPELDEDSVDQSNFGPGYVPSETFSWSESNQQPVQRQAAPEPPAAPPEPEQPTYADAELQADADPMQWLNSLAGNQEEDLFESDEALIEVDPESTDFVIDEQQDTGSIEAILDAGGPVDADDLFADMGMVDEASGITVMDDDEFELTAEDSMSWLEDLAQDQGTEVSDFLSELTDSEDVLPGFDLEYDDDSDVLGLQFTDDDSDGTDLIQGLSDEEVAQMQLNGTITPEQELAWLTQKADQLSDLRDDDDGEFAVDAEITDDIEPGEMPAWLQAKMQQADDDDTGSATFVDDIITPDEPDDLPMWLAEDPDAAENELGLDELELEDTSQVELVDPIATVVDDPALELSEDILAEYDPSLDHWTEALDQEYEGSPSEADEIYSAAAVQVEQQMAADAAEQEEAQLEDDFEVIEAGMDWLGDTVAADDAFEDDGDMPAWLRPSTESETSGDISEWLREQQAGGFDADEAIGWTTEPVPDVDTEDLAWLTEDISAQDPQQPQVAATSTPPRVPAPQAPVVAAVPSPPEETLPAGVDGAFPNWYLRETGQEPTPIQAPVPVQQVAPPPRRVTAPPVREVPRTPPPPPPRELVPVTELDGLAQAVNQNPADHQARLRLARGLSDNQRLNEGLQQYETLVNQTAALDAVAQDLSRIINSIPQHPKARRLLGDVYMRQGRLQEALDTYRGALSQI